MKFMNVQLKTIKIVSILIILFLCNTETKLAAQNFIDLLNFGTNYNPQNKYVNSDTNFTFCHNFINLQYPHVFENKDIFLSKISVNHYQKTESEILDLYIIYLQMGLQKKINEKLSFKFALTPKICSQLKAVHSNDFVYSAYALAQFKPKNNISYGFGLLYSYEFFGHFLNPAIFVDWDINDSWKFYCDFPSYGYLMYREKKWFKTGAYVSSSTTSIRLSDKYNQNYIQKSYADFSLFYDLYFTKSIVLRSKVGYSTMRSLDLYGKNERVPFTFSVIEFNDNRTQLNRDINSTYFFEASLNYRFHY